MSKKYEIDLPLSDTDTLVIGISFPLEDIMCNDYFSLYADNGKNRIRIMDTIFHGPSLQIEAFEKALNNELSCTNRTFEEIKEEGNFAVYNFFHIEIIIHNDTDGRIIATVFSVYPYNALGKKTNLPEKEWKRQHKPFIRTVVSRERLQLLVEKLQKIYDKIYSNGVPTEN